MSSFKLNITTGSVNSAVMEFTAGINHIFEFTSWPRALERTVTAVLSVRVNVHVWTIQIISVVCVSPVVCMLVRLSSTTSHHPGSLTKIIVSLTSNRILNRSWFSFYFGRFWGIWDFCHRLNTTECRGARCTEKHLNTQQAFCWQFEDYFWPVFQSV